MLDKQQLLRDLRQYRGNSYELTIEESDYLIQLVELDIIKEQEHERRSK